MMLTRTVFKGCWYVRLIAIACLVCAMVAILRAQTGTQLPPPTSHLNDFAGVVNTQAKDHLEGLLAGLKEKTKIDFFVATVDGTAGLDIADFSRQLAADWKIGTRTATTKSLLLVVSVASKSSFTQFSRLVQGDLPEGILGNMGQRMRSLLAAGRFSEAVEQGILLFLDETGPKLGFAVQDLENTMPANAAGTEPPVLQHPENVPAQTRPRVVGEVSRAKEDETTTSPNQVEGKPAATDPTTTESNTAKEPEKKITSSQPPKASVKTAKTPPPKEADEPVDDEAEAEEVELTLTLPLPKRAETLKSFLETRPDSKARPRATELLISTYAGLGDQFLKAGDVQKGVEHMMLAIDEADVGISEQLFSRVIEQIPSNLLIRGQAETAFQAAAKIEEKFGSDPKRLLGLSTFYLGIEHGDEAQRLAEKAVQLAPELAEAHRVLALSHHINLQLDEAATEYKKTVDLDPTSRASLNTLADLMRAHGKFEEALAHYDELLKSDPKDRSATAGRVLCLFELGRTDEGTAALENAVASEPGNLALLSGMAYWLAAHEDYQKAFELARQAIQIEPRYTWAQIALVRSLIGLNRHVGAERAMRYARQYGKFPTLNYELANVVAAMGFYDEAVEILRQSFTFKNGEVETLLAGRIPAHDKDFLPLLGLERRASIYQPTAADSRENSKMLAHLLALDFALSQTEGEKPDPTVAAEAAREFASGDDSMKTFRQLYAANRLVKKLVALPTALELVEAANQGLETALDSPVATTASQAEEYRNLRAQAIANGKIPDVAEAPRSALSNIMRGRVQELTGWILFNQDKYSEAIERLTEASTILPNGTPLWRNTLWHLGAALEQTGRNDEALDNYIKSYTAGDRDPVRRSIIEGLYRKVNGSTSGLEDRVGPAFGANNNQPTENSIPTPTSTPVTSPENSSSTTGSTTTETSKPQPPANPAPTPETTETPTPEPTTSPTSTETPQSPKPEPISEETLRAVGARLRSNIRISGRILDTNRNGISNVVVVLISPSGSVLASTTDKEGFYSFSVAPSQKTYRLIPSKDGYSFSPIDKLFPSLMDDQKLVDFTGSLNRSP